MKRYMGNQVHATQVHKSFSQMVGFFLLSTLISLVPFHSIVASLFPYYKEVIAFGFLLLLGRQCASRGIRFRGSWETYACSALVLFPFLLTLWSVFHRGGQLYPDTVLVESTYQSDFSPSIYILRNAYLYLPMVLYFALRGITVSEVRTIAIICLIIAPLSISVFIGTSINVDYSKLLLSDGAGLAYTTYVPYLTFSCLCALYLITSDTPTVLKLFAIAILTALVSFSIISTSRQATIFIVICGSSFGTIASSRSLYSKLLIAAMVIIVAYTVFFLVAYNFEMSDKLFNRFTSISELIDTERTTIAWDGLVLLEPHQYLIGAGLESVMGPDPHNDYVRWCQRVGIITMLIGIAPFVIAAFRVPSPFCIGDHRALRLFVLLSVCMTLFYSWFGFPRESAYQSLFSFLGLAIALGIKKTASPPPCQ